MFLAFLSRSPCPGPIDVLTDTYSFLLGDGENLCDGLPAFVS
jgi:hypothetical protein